MLAGSKPNPLRENTTEEYMFYRWDAKAPKDNSLYKYGCYISFVIFRTTTHTVIHHLFILLCSRLKACDNVNNSIWQDLLECGPMPNLMVALPNIGGALCSMPQSLADAH